jgi:hypothetical protein
LAKLKVTKWFRALAFLVALMPGAAIADYYPSAGTLYYHGFTYMSSSMRWSSPGPWSSPAQGTPGYEHDLYVEDSNYFPYCSSVTNLPVGYDDCPTAGVSEPNGMVFSFGSFDATQIQANKVYTGTWTFGGWGPVTQSYFELQGQENESRCPGGFNSIWCRFSLRTHLLLAGNLNWGGAPTTLYW